MDWCWSWNSNTLSTSCKELTHWKRPWCWEGLGAGGEGDNRGWDGWMVSLTRWTWVWVNSGSWWWTGRPGMLQFMGLLRVRHDWATELNWVQQRKMARDFVIGAREIVGGGSSPLTLWPDFELSQILVEESLWFLLKWKLLCPTSHILNDALRMEFEEYAYWQEQTNY